MRRWNKRSLIQKYLILGIAVFFAIGLNKSFVPNATALDKENISGFDAITGTVQQVENLKTVAAEGEKIYYISQQSVNSTAELCSDTALYHLEFSMSNWRAEPWKFTKTGSITGVNETELTVYDLPVLLQQGGIYVPVDTHCGFLSEKRTAESAVL